MFRQYLDILFFHPLAFPWQLSKTIEVHLARIFIFDFFQRKGRKLGTLLSLRDRTRQKIIPTSIPTKEKFSDTLYTLVFHSNANTLELRHNTKRKKKHPENVKKFFTFLNSFSYAHFVITFLLSIKIPTSSPPRRRPSEYRP